MDEEFWNSFVETCDTDSATVTEVGIEWLENINLAWSIGITVKCTFIKTASDNRLTQDVTKDQSL